MTEWDAAEYSRRSGLQEAMAEEVLALLDLKGSERVLDVGCGDGKITAAVATRVPRGEVLGVDASLDMITFASSHFDPAVRPNLRFEVADARRLPFKNEFDLVISFNALHWVPEQEAALRSIRSAMKSDGRALLRLVPAGERKSLENVIEETRLSSRWVASFQEFRDPYLHLTPEQYSGREERSACASPAHGSQGLEFSVPRGIFCFLRGGLHRMDTATARGRTAGVHKRCPGSLPAYSSGSSRRREYFQVLSDGCHACPGLGEVEFERACQNNA
jgi:trans-aconitate 2-methyltransferase